MTNSAFHQQARNKKQELSPLIHFHSSDVVKHLNIPKDHLVYTNNIDDPILRAKEKYKNHQSIQLIKCHYEKKQNILLQVTKHIPK